MDEGTEESSDDGSGRVRVLEKRINLFKDAASVPLKSGATSGMWPFDSEGIDMSEGQWADAASAISYDADPYTRSPRRDGLEVWDRAVCIPACAKCRYGELQKPGSAASRNVNSEWESVTKQELNRVGTPDGKHLIRPSGKWIFDAMPHMWRMIEGAHALSHRIGDRASVRSNGSECLYGENSWLFQACFLKMAASRILGLPMDFAPTVSSPGATNCGDWCERYGIRIFQAGNIRKPDLMVPAFGKGSLVRDRDVACLCGGVFVEPHPSNAGKSMSWIEANRWSCEPTIAALCGWECADAVCHAEAVSFEPWNQKSQVFYEMPAASLMGMDGFSELLEAAERSRGRPEPDGKRYFMVDDWLESADFRKAISESPPLPCKSCIRPNSRTEGAVRRPKGKRPLEKIRKSSRLWTGEEEWLEYCEFMESCLGICRGACEFCEGREIGFSESGRLRKARERGYRNKMASLAKAASLRKKRARLINGGKPTEAAALSREIARLEGGCL